MASEVQRLARLDLMTIGDLARAVIELAIARGRLRSQHIKAIMSDPLAGSTILRPEQAARVDRVAFAIPRVAVRLPWRADCLIQALAAKRWLDRNGIATALHIGVRMDPSVDFDAHAWLIAGDRVVTGGNVANYAPLTQFNARPVPSETSVVSETKNHGPTKQT